MVGSPGCPNLEIISRGMVINQPENEKKPKAPDWLIENIAEASKNARKIYFLYIGFLAYCALTVVSTTDRQIILNDTARLPVLNVEVSLHGFFIFAPLIAIFVFAYLQLYVDRLRGLITDLRTNYAPVEKRRLYPWMLNIAEDAEPGFVGWLQKRAVEFSLWWSLPIVLILFAFWFVRKHDPLWCYVVGMLPIAGTFVVLYFWCRYEDTQVRSGTKIGPILAFVRKNGGKTVLASIALLFEVSLLFFIIPWAFEGGKSGLNPWICVDLSYQKLITEPSIDYKTIYWADLRGAHLEGADLTCAILKRADLRGAHLKRARLWSATLEGARLQYADLRQASFWRANLSQAVFHLADLQDASLGETDLRGAKYLTVEQLSKVKTLWHAKLDSTRMEQIREDYPHLLEEPKDDE